MKLAIVAITPRGAELARRLGAEAESAEVWLPEEFRQEDGCRYFPGPLRDLLPHLFAEVDGLVCIMATGIVVRLLAPHLRGKDCDAAVVVADEAGRFAISLLSGHLGGANELAEEVAELLGGQAVITTATDVNRLPAWDVVARREGMVVEPLAHLKALNRLLLDGRSIALVDRDGRVTRAFAEIEGIRTCASFAEALSSGCEGTVFVSNRYVPQLERQPAVLVLRPRNLVLGIGCNRGTVADEIEAAVQQALKHAFLAFPSIALVASIEAKGDEAGLLEFTARHGLGLRLFSAEELNAVTVPSPASEHALAAVGAQGVCEPAALLGAQHGSLLVKKKKLGNVTVAVAEMVPA